MYGAVDRAEIAHRLYLCSGESKQNLTELRKTITCGEADSTDALAVLPRHRGDGRDGGVRTLHRPH